jgi:hypothetical protein
LNVVGFESGAVLTLAQSGNTVKSTYVDQNGVTQSLTFSTTTGTSATLAEKGQVIPGFTGLCVMGPGNERTYPVSMTATAGALTYNGGTVFVTLIGGLKSDARACPTLSAAKESFWLLCKDPQGGVLPSVDSGPPSVTQLPAGRYSCNSQVATYASINGENQFVAGGGSGTLTLTENGAKVTAQYSGDSSIAGTLRLIATTSRTANAGPNQTLMAPCTVPIRLGTSQTPEPVPIAAGSLIINDSTLFLSFTGSMSASSSCPRGQVAGSVICSK